MKIKCLLLVVCLTCIRSWSSTGIVEKKFIQDGQELVIKLEADTVVVEDGLIAKAVIAEDFQARTHKVQYSFPKGFFYHEVNTIEYYRVDGLPFTAPLVFITNGYTDRTVLATLIDGDQPMSIHNGGISGSEVTFYRSNLMPATVDMRYNKFKIQDKILSIAPFSFHPDGSVRSGAFWEYYHGTNRGPQAKLKVRDQEVTANFFIFSQTGKLQRISLFSKAKLKVAGSDSVIEVGGYDEGCWRAWGDVIFNDDEEVVASCAPRN